MGKDERVPVHILRDTGAHDSFISEKVLPFSKESETVCNLLEQPMYVPLHTVVLESDLVCGEVGLGLRPGMSVEGVDIILGTWLGDWCGRGFPATTTTHCC